MDRMKRFIYITTILNSVNREATVDGTSDVHLGNTTVSENEFI